jgi:hypothetical protein
MLPEDDPNVFFELFVEWMYFQKFTFNGTDTCIRAWSFGDQTDAEEFRDYAMHLLYRRFIPSKTDRVRVYGVRASQVRLSCNHSHPRSHLWQFFIAFLVAYWDPEEKRVEITKDTKEVWDQAWSENPKFRDELYFQIGTKDKAERISLPYQDKSD